MKKLLSLLLLSLFLLCSCGRDADTPSGMKLASDTSVVDYSLFVPNSWIVDRHDGTTMAHVSDSDRSSISVAQWNLTNELSSFEKWWTDYKNQISSVFAEMTVKTEAESIIIDKTAAQKYVYTANLANDEYSYMVTAVIKNGSIYVITYTSVGDPDDENSLYRKNLDAVNSVLENFKFA